MSDVTQILLKIESGDPSAAENLLPLVYEELRRLAAARMAHERADHTLQSTALVHEAYVRLVDQKRLQKWDSRGHFFSAAAEAMRRILIESAQRRGALRNGGDLRRVEFDHNLEQTLNAQPDLLLDLNAGIERLQAEEPEAAELVKLRFFAGLSITAAGEALGISKRKAYETWEFAEAWFAVWLKQTGA
ncbi:ECF-type sigma factor [Novipirellula artificiosorum]|uniref:ECF sigma factor n=1 Tax=Novipirellula artificiosorum TaxID=2528016 RepID=A0A5C6DD96_9BACT|nr:ECF-type sigma factor [Novipirellula artificiosorum]TWU33854.1 ECF sigma factor [Novipirellula artificiosorum]